MRPKACAAPQRLDGLPKRCARGCGDREDQRIPRERGEPACCITCTAPAGGEEHTDPHLIAGWRHPAELEPPLRQTATVISRGCPACSSSPTTRSATRGYERPVWHCSARAAPGDRMLSDAEWARLAGEMMHRTGHDSLAERVAGIRSQKACQSLPPMSCSPCGVTRWRSVPVTSE